MRLVFAGTPAFARVGLSALLSAGHDIALVLTQPDRPAGRGLRAQPSDVKIFAEEHGLPLAQPVGLRQEQAHALLKQAGADAMVVAAYGLILPQAVLDLFPLGCLNIHASLLPRWRGAAPIQRAILAGDACTGVTIMQMDAGLDTGPIYLQEQVAIDAQDTAGLLQDKLAELGGRLIVSVLDRIRTNRLEPQPQPRDGVTYARKVDKSEVQLDWTRSAAELDRAVRAFNPTPVAVTRLRGEPLRIWRAQPVEAEGGTPGLVCAVGPAGLVVECGAGLLRLLELQRPGGRRLPVREFLLGCTIAPGERLGS